MNNLKSVIDNLKSDKIKDRQEGLTTLRQVFSQDRVAAKFHINKDGKENPKVWLPVFTALFESVRKEKLLVTKKTAGNSSATALRRLSDAASTVRWLIERAIHAMDGRIVTILFDHMTQMLSSDPTPTAHLFTPVALDYAKALKCIALHKPHLEHLKEYAWIKMVEKSFNVVLGDPINSKFAQDEEKDLAMDVDSDMYVDDEMEEADDDKNLRIGTSGNGHKRSRSEQSTTSMISPQQAKSQVKRKRNLVHVVSPEQFEFASLLSVLLGSPVAPILSPEYPNLASGILIRLNRFLQRYPTESSLLRDYLASLTSILKHLSLNKKHEVEIFARSAWDGLVGLWGTKDKLLKESLVIVLRHLFEFVTCPSFHDNPKLPFFDCAQEIRRLWSLLTGEAESRWGVDGLNLDSMRLQNIDATYECYERSGIKEPFTAKTFRIGWNFDAGQALSWAILELQADCAAKLYQLSESMQDFRSPGPHPKNKRIKQEDPIDSLLHSIQRASGPPVRSYHLQALLFIVDRHWLLLHEELKQTIMNILLQYAQSEDVAQPWIYLNFAAISYAEGSRITRKSAGFVTCLDSNLWDLVWSHCIQRANRSISCRAACHASQTLLNSFYSHGSKSSLISLSPSRVLQEIETLVKDMDVQGPSYPFDSVCMFLSQCLTIVGQDSRLYRMHLENKVLSWFIDSWKLPSGRIKMAPYWTTDILLLLETICSISKRVDLKFQPSLPDSEIVDDVVEENKVKIIRDFMLYAKIPKFVQQQDATSRLSFHKGGLNATDVGRNNVSDRIQLASASGKERKISSFFLKSLESLLGEWENSKDNHGFTTAERARQLLDIAVAAIVFESLLTFNDIGCNQQLLQKAGEVIKLLTQLLVTLNWSLTEILLVAQALEPLIYDMESLDDGACSEALSPPGVESGIKEQTLQRLLLGRARNNTDAERLALLRLIWQNDEVRDPLQLVISTLRNVLENLLNGNSSDAEAQPMDLDDKDGFDQIRTNVRSPILNTRREDIGRPIQHLLRLCIGFLGCGPFLQSPSAKPTRDKQLLGLVLQSVRNRQEIFLATCAIFLRAYRQGNLSLPREYLYEVFVEFKRMRNEYTFARNTSFHHLVVDLLRSSIEIWNSKHHLAPKILSSFRTLCRWFSETLREHKFHSWTFRDAAARFLDEYITADPTQQSWWGDETEEVGSEEEEKDDEDIEEDRQNRLPTSLLLSLNSDCDTRVRFRVAVINAALYPLSHHLGLLPLELYDLMKQTYTRDIHSYEHMLTRMLSLGNIMVVSSAVRRGSYWHLLETCIHSQEYSDHIESILTGVSERLGFPSLSVLFDAYASQLAYSVRSSDSDFTAFPPHLLGYRDRKQAAQAAFRPFTPTNILADDRHRFEIHCKILHKTVTEGLQDCFGDIIGYHILIWLDNPANSVDGLWESLKVLMAPLEDLKSIFHENVDSIVTMLLRSLSEQDFTEDGPVLSALRSFDPNGKIPSAFLALTSYRAADTFQRHEANLPNFPAQTILKGLVWISSREGDAFTRATSYHILHGLMDEIHHTPLVNEQNRLLNAMAIWMAYRRHDFEDMTILQSILRGATLLLLQADLARSAQSILEWAFENYRHIKLKETHLQHSCLPDVLVRICYIANDYSTNQNKVIAEMGSNLLTWIDQQLYSFSTVSVFEPVVQKTLAAWPFPPSSHLLPLYERITMADLTAVLEDHHIASNKFRLVRRIKENAVDYGDGDTQYSKTYFWRLKECMPPPDRLQDEDITSFAALLSLNRGKLSNFNPERPDHNAPRPRHRRMFKKKEYWDNSSSSRETKPLVLSRDAITMGLLMMLEDEDPLHVSGAYHTLRLIVAIRLPEHSARLPLPAEYQTEVQYLKIYRRSPAIRPICDLREKLESDLYLNCANNFAQWISLIAILLSDTLAVIDSFFGQLSSILASDINFADEIFPILVHTLLQLEKEKRLDLAYALHEVLLNYLMLVLSSATTDVSCIRSIVDTVLHLRYFNWRTRDALSYTKWLKFDYPLLARSAIVCGAYTTALLFIETALDDGHDEVTGVEQVLYEIYAHIDEPDGFYGIKTNDLQQFLIKRFHHEKQWDKAFRFHGAALEAGNSLMGEEEGLLESFHYFGFDHLAIDTLRNSTDQSSGGAISSSMNYKLGWRTETWDLPDQTKDSPGAPLYRSLRAIYRERDPRVLEKTIQSALLAEMDHLRSLGSENLAEIRAVSQDLMCLGEVSRWTQVDFQQLLKPENVGLDEWKDFVKIDPAFTFSDLESLMATRIALIRSVRQQEERRQLGSFVTSFVRKLKDIEKTCLLRLSEAARASGQIQIALNSIVRAQRLDERPSSEVSEEFANVLWLQKEETLAVRYLHGLVRSDDAASESQIDPSRKALWLSRLGTWSAEACLEKPSEISRRYFDRSIALLEQIKEQPGRFDTSLARIYRECAMFAERQYHSTLKSPDAIRWKVYVDRKIQEINQRGTELRSQTDPTKRGALGIELKKAQKLLAEDSELFRGHNILRDTLLRQAIDMHSRCLETSDDFNNDSATRFCSLWFANFEDESILDCVKAASARIPSRKLIFLAHQITARVATPSSSPLSQIQDNLQGLVLRMCQEHPFHILYQIYCLSNHSTITTARRRQSGRQLSQSTQTDRSTAANSILDRLRLDKMASQRLQDMEKLCDACLQWAKLPIKGDPRFNTKQKGISFKIPTEQKLLRVSNLRVPVTTVNTPLDPTLQYNDCVWIQSYEPTFDTAGGANRPKISICLGSDGQKYKQLFKGEGSDDLRQDAVMEQVFDLVNNILKRDRETRRRELRVRDYKVIPLASQAGILEFVGNTSPFRDWLYAKHPFYRPGDIKPQDFHAGIQDVQERYAGNHEKQLEYFLKTRERFKPVMRHYFTEKHKEPIAWFQMRLNYTRSVATTSIVGHILGLGDRHISNILMDNMSGEVVHIDLGIAFDQGKLLTIPERVPFRMTADIVDGMGPAGTSGVFQRCAEETLRVLRNESEVIMTVLEVFKHDPLHSWTANEIKVKQAQSDATTNVTDATHFNYGIGIDMSSGTVDEAADRALSSVARKLDKSLSVESTVNELLAEATDPMNLATIYYGWSAHI